MEYAKSLVTLPRYDASHMGPVTKVAHRVIVRIGRRVWPIPISHKVITTKDLEARTDATTQLSRLELVHSHERSLEGSYSRVSVLDAAVDDRNSSPSPQDTVLVQLLDSSDAVDRVVRSGSVIA